MSGVVLRVTSPHPLDCRYVSAERHNTRSQPRWAAALLLSKPTEIWNSFIIGNHDSRCNSSTALSCVCFPILNSLPSRFEQNRASWRHPCRRAKSLRVIPLIPPNWHQFRPIRCCHLDFFLPWRPLPRHLLTKIVPKILLKMRDLATFANTTFSSSIRISKRAYHLKA